ncbi:ABC transporter permease [Planosporangium flavigriseum]|uniref:ABC transporter permease n=1 Tax=Planosporangium flavigriseum TaxID=373681 RepID=A0A8J3LIA0_9ACTN|nr:ABC transporter permease [Planosporangium flavigriseum]NJC63727.1 ABC transporter permease [Planosporangium flavigriseum]GIG73778.1 ABC transporter permease [Planosporangium flavigriseum]
MNSVQQMMNWLNDPLNWTNPDGIVARLLEHLRLCGGALLLACLVAWPTGIALGRRGRGSGLVVALSNATQAIPVVALLTILPLTAVGFGARPVILALAVFAAPPLLATAHTGMREVDAEVRDAARGMGLSGWQLLWRVELPLGVPYLAAGLRTAAVQVVATAGLAALVNGGGLGMIVAAGFGLQSAGQILAGGLLIAGLALLVEALLAGVQRLVTPGSLRRI